MLEERKFFCLVVLGVVFLAALAFLYLLYREELLFYDTLFAQISGVKTDYCGRNLNVVFVGDVMLDRGVEYSINENGEESFNFPFQKSKDFLNKADLLFGNLESVISDKGIRMGSIYSFRAEPEAVEGLLFAGFDIVSVANNHIFDYGREAMEDSFRRLDKAGIKRVGGGFSEKEAREPVIVEKEGVRIAFLSYTDQAIVHWRAEGERSGISWLDQELEKEIKEAAGDSDIVVVSLHFGQEYQKEPGSEQKRLARLAVDSGADLVIGHHPHVVQPVRRYNKGFIAYSLGNFVFDQGFSEETMNGIALKVLIRCGEIREVTVRGFEINEFFQPEI